MAGIKVVAALLAEALAYKEANLDGGSLRLYQNDMTPTPNSVVGDFTIADFGGYTSKTIATWGDPWIDALGRAITLAPTQTWAATGVAPSNLVYGWYFLDVNGDLALAGRFDAPVSMGVVTDALPLAISTIDAQPA